MQAAGRTAEVFGVNRQLQEQELLAAEEGQEQDGQEQGRDWLPRFGDEQHVSKGSWGGCEAPHAC